jgi:hypothetical protein
LRRSLPVTFSEVYEGLAEAHGIVRAESWGIALEYEVADAFLGVLKSGVKEARIPYEDLETVEATRGFLSGGLQIRVRSLRALEGIPGGKKDTLTLGVARKDRAAAEEFASTIALLQAEHEVRVG